MQDLATPTNKSTSIEDIIQIKQLEHGRDLPLPRYATANSAGMDLFAANIDDITIKPGAYAMINSGIAIALPPAYEVQIRPRSGLAAKFGVTVLNSPGTIDADYRGELKVLLINHGSEDFIVERGMRIAQMVIAQVATLPLAQVEQLEETSRGEGGFGSTGQ